MKKTILGIALLATVSTSFANTLTNTSTSKLINVKGNPRIRPNSPASIATFNAMFPGATNVKWQIKGELGYGVTFVYNGVKMTAVFSFFTGAYIGA